jgi:hypothetical protein
MPCKLPHALTPTRLIDSIAEFFVPVRSLENNFLQGVRSAQDLSFYQHLSDNIIQALISAVGPEICFMKFWTSMLLQLSP